MAKITQCLGIDIGSHSIRIAEVSLGSSGIEVRNLAEARLQLDPGQAPADRHGAIAAQVNGLLKTAKVKARHAVFCVPGQTVFVRQLRVPATTPERLQKIIQFEAREQIPFPLDQTQVEYEVFKSDSPNEVEVLLVAMRKDHIEGFMKMVKRTGLKPLAISVSSLALHNFHEVNASPKDLLDRPARRAAGGSIEDDGKGKSEKKKKKKGEPEAEAPAPDDSFGGMEFEEVAAEVNLGATLMDLAIPKAGVRRLIGFTRSVPRAGLQIDQAIRSRLNLSSLEQAQAIKEQQAAVLSSEFELSGDTTSVNMPASQAVTAVVDALAAEIRRSLDFFISQPDGVAVDSIALSGGLSRLPYLDSYIEEKLGLPVKIASIRNEAVKCPDELADRVPCFAIPLGLAFQGLGVSQVGVDFLPQDIKDVRAFAENRIQLAAAGVMLLLAIGAGMGAGGRYIQLNKGRVQKIEEDVSRSQQDNRELGRVRELNGIVAGKYANLAKVAGSPAQWLDFSLLVLETRPPDILLERVEMFRNGIVEISGVTPKKSSITSFADSLRQKTDIVQEAEIVDLPDDPARNTHPDFPGQVQAFKMSVRTTSRDGRWRPLKTYPAVAAAPGAAASTPRPSGAPPAGRPRGTPDPRMR